MRAPRAPQPELVAPVTQGGPIERLFWFASPVATARHRLRQAQQRGLDGPSLRHLEQALAGLTSPPTKDPKIQRLAGDIIVMLAEAALKSEAGGPATRWLGELDRSCPQHAARTALRCDLLDLLARIGDFTEHGNQAGLLLADPQLSFAQRRDAILRAIETVYLRLDPASCGDMLDAAPINLLVEPEIRAAAVLCRCPRVFKTTADAAKWRPIEPDLLQFSPRLQAAAFVAKARALEWRGNWKGMREAAVRAVELDPHSPDALYWAVRATLHGTASLPRDYVEAIGDVQSGRWRRLRAAVSLHREPSFENVEALLAALDGRKTDDPQEENLIVALAREVLDAGLAWPPERTERARALCLQLEESTGQHPWTQVSIAIAELKTGRYADAAKRLADGVVESHSAAPALRRLAAILAGERPSLGAGDEPGCLAIVEAAVAGLFEPAGSGTNNRQKLFDELATARADRWCEWFAGLACVVDGVRWLLGRADGAVRGEAWQPPEATPAWLQYLCLREWLAQQGPVPQDEPPPLGPKVARAWATELWWSLYSPRSALPPAFVLPSRELLNSHLAPIDGLAALRGARAGLLSSLGNDPMPRMDWGMGPLATAICDQETSFECDYLRARRELAAGRHEPAVGLFASLTKRGHELPPALSGWWRPVAAYWHGVALSRKDARAARTVLGKLVDGPKGADARAQLALLSLSQNDLAAAEHDLDGAAPVTPAATYARGLLQARRGDADGAKATLRLLAEDLGMCSPQYSLAARRLLAALAERAGDLAAAEQIHGDILVDNPADPITCARLTRIRVRQAYDRVREGAPAAAVGTLPPRTEAQIPWTRRYLLLHRLLVSPTLNLSLPANAHSPAWRQLIARRFLQARAWENAHDALADPEAGEPEWQARTRLILSAASLLKRVAEAGLAEAACAGSDPPEPERRRGNRAQRGHAPAPPPHAADLRACAEALGALPAANSDPVLHHWQFLLADAAEHGADDAAPATDWSALAPWPLAQLPGLWSADAQQRAAAGRSLAEAVAATEFRCTAEQRLLLQAISALACGTDADFVEAYSVLEPILGELPIDARDLWLRAASAWFRGRDWNRLLASELPESIADLTDPQVRLVMGLAYARAAADDSVQGDIRQALQHARQARETLGTLLEG